jgi:hypothetical protein
VKLARMNTTTLGYRRSQPRELDHREQDGIAVTLRYQEPNRVAVRVIDNTTGEELEVEVAAHDAVDAFRHPYAYILPAAA